MYYETGDEKSEYAIVVCYDIFGFSPQAMQVCDMIAEGVGARVIMPDFLDGEPWPLDKPIVASELMKWIGEVGTWEKLGASWTALVERLRAQGVKKIGAMGFCWGGKVAMKATEAGLSDATASPHPSFFRHDFFHPLPKAPVCLLLSKDDPQMEEEEKLVKAHEGSNPISVFERFPNMHHGFMAARGDFNNPENKREMERGVNILINFYKKAFGLA